MATRYSGSYVPEGEGALPRVDAYTVWNEPNRGQFLQPQGAHGWEAPKVMARLMGPCQSAIHAVSPDSDVALGPLASRGGQGGIAPIAFLTRYRAAGGVRPGVVALNPYLGSLLPVYRGDEQEADGAITVRNLDRLEQYLEDAYGERVPIWLTEFAWRTANQPGIGLITPERQAELAEQSVDLVREHYPYAEMLVWFLIRDVSPTSYWRSGLVTHGNEKKPAFGVWQRLARSDDGETLPSPIMLALWIVIAIVVIALLWLVFAYNKFVRLRNEAEQGFSGIDVQLKRRADLIPNLVETVKAYATHEREVFERVAEARQQALAARGVAQAASADVVMTAALTGLFGIAEAYPELRASENFQRLQAELSDTEDKIAAARRYYNTTVRRFNSLIQSVPTKSSRVSAASASASSSASRPMRNARPCLSACREPAGADPREPRSQLVRDARICLLIAFSGPRSGSRSIPASASCSRSSASATASSRTSAPAGSSRASRTRIR